MVDEIDLVPHLDDLEQFSLLEDLQHPVNPFDIPIQEEISEMPSVVLMNKHECLGIYMPVAPRRDTADRIENGECYKNDGYNRDGQHAFCAQS